MKGLEIVSVAIVALIVYLPLIKILNNYVNSLIDNWQLNEKIANNDILNLYIDQAQEIVESIVIQVNQTFTDSLKASGSFNKEAQAEAKQKALDLSKVLIRKELRAAIETVYGSFNIWLDTMIEATVNNLKN